MSGSSAEAPADGADGGPPTHPLAPEAIASHEYVARAGGRQFLSSQPALVRRSAAINNAWSAAMSDLAPMDSFNWKRVQVDVVETSNVDRPTIERLYAFTQLLFGRITRAPERQYPAGRAEVVLRSPRPPFVQHQILPGAQQTKMVFRHAKIERPAPSTHRAVAHTNVINLGFDLEPHSPAMAGAGVASHGAKLTRGPSARLVQRVLSRRRGQPAV